MLFCPYTIPKLIFSSLSLCCYSLTVVCYDTMIRFYQVIDGLSEHHSRKQIYYDTKDTESVMENYIRNDEWQTIWFMYCKNSTICAWTYLLFMLEAHPRRWLSIKMYSYQQPSSERYYCLIDLLFPAKKSNNRFDAIYFL